MPFWGLGWSPGPSEKEGAGEGRGIGGWGKDNGQSIGSQPSGPLDVKNRTGLRTKKKDPDNNKTYFCTKNAGKMRVTTRKRRLATRGRAKKKIQFEEATRTQTQKSWGSHRRRGMLTKEKPARKGTLSFVERPRIMSQQKTVFCLGGKERDAELQTGEQKWQTIKHARI